jgi:hypothetical protein
MPGAKSENKNEKKKSFLKMGYLALPKVISDHDKDIKN